MRRTLLLLSLLTLGVQLAEAQMVNGQDTLFGDEWIVDGQIYLRIPVAQPGVYHISIEQLAAAGWPVETLSGKQFELYRQGQSEPLYVSSPESLTNSDFLSFHGRPNRGELDTHLFADAAAQQLNPAYSLYTDTAVYFLTYLQEGVSSQQYLTIDAAPLPEATTVPYIWRTVEKVYSSKFIKEYVRITGLSVRYSHFTVSEGYGNRSEQDFLSANGSRETLTTLSATNAIANGPEAQLSLRYGCGPDQHLQEIRVDGNPLISLEDRDWVVRQYDTSIDGQLLSDERLEVLISGTAEVDGAPQLRDKASVAFVRLTYPALPNADDANELAFQLEAHQAPLRLAIEEFAGGTGRPVLLDRANGQRILGRLEQGVVVFYLPPASQDRELLLYNEAAGGKSVDVLTAARFPQAIDFDLDYLMITSERLTSNSSALDEYVAYRESADGGSYRVETVLVEDLYDAFSYGVQRHPLAIKNFLSWIKRQAPGLEHLLIVGKGREYNQLRSADQLNEAQPSFFVPSFGFPASDVLLTSPVSTFAPQMAVGRLPVIGPEDITLYLNKLKEVEAQKNAPQTIDGKAWMKNILHLGGGTGPEEQTQIRNHLERMESIINDNEFGGEVTAFYKTGTDPIETARSDRIFDRINEGTSIISFFGHSGANTFDFSIDNPENYFNRGKYPLMLSLGCYSGNQFIETRSIGERFVFLEQGGAMAFGATRGLGFVGALGPFAAEFYEVAGSSGYGKTIGQIAREATGRFSNFRGYGFGTLIEQFGLIGDPAFRLHPQEGPDYAFDPDGVVFDPPVVAAQADSFELQLRLTNLGRNTKDSLEIKIEQELPDGTLLPAVSATVLAPAYSEDYQFRIATQGNAAIGLNTIYAQIDPQNKLDELPAPAAIQNNELIANDRPGAPFFVVANTALPQYPGEYALVGGPQLELLARTTDPLTGERLYQLEIDTVPDFEPPLLRATIRQEGGLVRWKPALAWQDSTVYYWRVSPDASETENQAFVWESSSFTYASNAAEGWAQAHWGQWEENSFDEMQLDARRDFEFFGQDVNVELLNGLWDGGQLRPGLIYDFASYAGSVRPWRFLREGIAVVVSEPTSASFWTNPPDDRFEEGDYGLPTGNSRVFAFPTETLEQRENLLTFLDEVVPIGYFVFLYTIQYDTTNQIYADTWQADQAITGRSIYSFLEQEGATTIRQLAEAELPYLLTYRKGFGIIKEAMADSLTQTIRMSIDIPRKATAGSMETTTVGPVDSWNFFRWNGTLSDTTDQNRLAIVGGSDIDAVADTLFQTTGFGTIDLQSVDPQQYPYLRAVWLANDETNRTPSNISWMQFDYTGLPDLLFDGSAHLVRGPDSLEQGEAYPFEIAVTNTQRVPSDSSVVRMRWLEGNQIVETTEFALPALSQLDTAHVVLDLDSKKAVGNQQLFLEINPDRSQQETNFANNSLSVRFAIGQDVLAPSMVVSFDGRQILDGELVSASPQIEVQVVDENQFLLLENPEDIALTITYPDGQQETLNGVDPRVQFIPGSAEDNTARLKYQPALLQDGIYQLRVNSADASGNRSGDLAYEVSFEVINESRISNVLPYPNPFSDRTYFVYTLTGEQVPLDYALTIMTVSGKVVRRLTAADLGPLQVGQHQTQFFWDGTDEFGDPLANGVYLYRMEVRDADGRQLEAHSTSVDRFFRNELGKLVILR